MDQLMVDVGDDAGRGRRRGRADRPPGRRARSPPRNGPSAWTRSRYTIVCGVGPRVPRRYRLSVAKRLGIAAGTLGGVAGLAYGAQRARRGADAPRARRRRAPARSTRRPTSITGSTRTTAARSTSSSAGASSTRRSCSRTASRSRCARGSTSSRSSRRRASARSRSTTAVTGSRCSARRATRSRTSAATSRPCSRVSTCTTRCSSVIRWAASRCSRSSRAIPEIAAERVAGHRAALDARVHAARVALDPHEGAAREGARSDRPTRSGCGTRPTSGSSRRASASARTRSPSHVELVRQMMARVPARDPPRRAARARRSRPHARIFRTCASRRSSSAGPPTC